MFFLILHFSHEVLDLPSLPLDKRLFFSIRKSLILVTKFKDMKSLVKTLNLVESFSLNSGLIMAQEPCSRKEECNLFLLLPSPLYAFGY